FAVAAVRLAFFVAHQAPKTEVAEKVDDGHTLRIAIPSGANFVQLATQYGVATDTAQQILNAAKDKYDLAKIVTGRELALIFDPTSSALKKLTYQIDSENRLIAQED